MPVEIKTVGASGQISLGKEYAGRTVMLEELESGVWLLRTAKVIPDNEAWLHEPAAQQSLERAIAWSAKSSRRDSDLSAMERKLKRSS